MCVEKKRPCSKKTYSILQAEKKRIMKETLESLAELRETLETKVA